MTVLTDTFWNSMNGPKMSGTVHPLKLTPIFMDMDSTDFTFQT